MCVNPLQRRVMLKDVNNANSIKENQRVSSLGLKLAEKEHEQNQKIANLLVADFQLEVKL